MALGVYISLRGVKLKLIGRNCKQTTLSAIQDQQKRYCDMNYVLVRNVGVCPLFTMQIDASKQIRRKCIFYANNASQRTFDGRQRVLLTDRHCQQCFNSMHIKAEI